MASDFYAFVTLIKVDFLWWIVSQYKMSFTFSVPATNTPTHIVVWQDSTVNSSSASTNVVMLTDRIAALENAISKISGSSAPAPLDASAPADQNTPLISGINMRRRDDSIGSLSALHPPDVRTILNALITSPILDSSEPMQVDDASSVNAEDADDADDEGVADEADADEADEANAEEETSQLDEADADAEAEEDAEEGIELEEFEYKGETYYKDPENLVYKMDADGDLDDQPIGIWNEEKKKVLKYSKS